MQQTATDNDYCFNAIEKVPRLPYKIVQFCELSVQKLYKHLWNGLFKTFFTFLALL